MFHKILKTVLNDIWKMLIHVTQKLYIAKDYKLPNFF
jgi:hypothetical protein